MATTFYLVRHGQSESNIHGVFAGQSDPLLTQIGHVQAAATADYFLRQCLTPDVILSSDLQRAYATAQHTADLFRLPVIKDEGLREIHAGSWEQMPFSEIAAKYPESYGVWRNNIGQAHCDGGESVQQLQTRIVDTLSRLAEEYPAHVVFLFTHATPIRVMAAHCLGKTPDEIKDIPWVVNASVTTVFHDKDGFMLVDYSRGDFLGNLTTALPANV